MIRQALHALFLVASCAIAANAQSIAFDDVTDAAGLREPLLGMMGHGGAWGDVDGDGLIDAYVGGFADRPDDEYKPAKTAPKNVLLKNLGDGKFARMEQPAAEFFARTSGAVFADLDNDGDLELYVANNTKGAPKAAGGRIREAQFCGSKLLRNDDGKLVDISAECGACPTSLRTARNIGVFDYNGDGLLDLFVVEDKFIKNPRSVLFKNLGGLKFVDANKEAGLPDDIFGLGLAVADINDDGRADFFVGHSNRFFLSTKDAKYSESPELNKTFAWEPLDGEDWPCGAAFGDLNRDGRLDMVLAIHFVQARNRVFLNDGVKDGVPQFRDVTKEVGLPSHEANKSPHVEIQDFDNDGWPDLYFSTAVLDSDGRATPIIYRNLGVSDAKSRTPKFARVSPAKTDDVVVYFPAGPSGDFDNDGRIDLLLINWFQENHGRLLHNVSNTKKEPLHHWLAVKVAGKTFDRMGIGSQIKVYPAGKLGDENALLGFQELTTGYGYASGQSAVCHFGLGNVDSVDLAIRWPNGKQLEQRGVEVDRALVIEEEQDATMEPRISFITLGVSDLARATAFYRDVLKLPQLPSPPEVVSFFEMGKTWLGLFPREELAKDARVVDDGMGFARFSLAHNVRSREEVDVLLAEVAAAGGRITKPGTVADWGGYCGYFADPDGFLWEVAWNPDFPHV